MPSGTVGRQGFLHPVEFVVDGGAFDEHRGRDCAAVASARCHWRFGVVAAAVAILPQSNQSWGRLDGCHDVGEGVAGPGHAQQDAVCQSGSVGACEWRGGEQLACALGQRTTGAVQMRACGVLDDADRACTGRLWVAVGVGGGASSHSTISIGEAAPSC
ncbi:hypothetical protein GS469_06825 [Rhodococcus hoagii]|nr:hypothetical protein [Prescottella equi]